MNVDLEFKHFVVIDDDPDSLQIVTDYLKSFNVKYIRSFNNGKDGLIYCSANKVDFIICDWEMPEMSGLDVLREIRKSERLKDTTFIMITSPISMEQVKVISAGLNQVSSYLIKPFRQRALLEKIMEAEIEKVYSSKKTAIVVDDDEVVRNLVADILTDCGFSSVIQTDRAEQAYQFLQEHLDQVALVVSDWEMPEMTGIEFLQRVRANSTLKETPFIMITSQTSLEKMKIQQAAHATVDQYLVKPFKIEVLQAKVATLLAQVKTHELVKFQLRLGETALAEGDLPEAKQHYENARHLDPNDTAPFMGLAKVEMSRRPTRDLKEAARYLQEALRADPRSVPAYLEIAQAFEMALAPEKATHILREALQLCPPNAEISFQMGRLLAKRGKTEEAIEHLQRAIELEPDHARSKTLLQNAMMIKPLYKKKK